MITAGRAIHFLTICLVAIGIAVPDMVWAAIRNPFLLDESPSSDSKKLDLTLIEKMRPSQAPVAFRTEDFIPTYLSPSSDEDYVASKIIFHSLNHLIDSPRFRRTSIGKAAATLDQTLNPQFTISSSGKDQIKHQVQFEVRPEQSQASIKYRGYIQAQLAYQVENKMIGFEMSQTLDSNTRVAFNHNMLAGQVTDTVTLNWSF